MPIEITQVNTANLVIANFEALNNEPGIYRFHEGVGAFVSTGAPEDGVVSLNINAERISVVRAPGGHTVIKRDFPTELDDLGRLAEVADLVIANTNTNFERYTYGFNVEAVCTQNAGVPTSLYLAERFFDLRGLSRTGLRDFGSESWQLEFSDDDRTWRMSVRRLENVFDVPNLFVTLNSHHENQPLPDKQSLVDRLTETWNGIPEFIEGLEHKS